MYCSTNLGIDNVLLEHTIWSIFVAADDELMAIGFKPFGNAQLGSEDNQNRYTKEDLWGIFKEIPYFRWYRASAVPQQLLCRRRRE